jgi:hypothetical protein
MRKTLVLTALTAVASVALLAGCSSSDTPSDTASSTAPTLKAPIVSIPGAITGEIARATYRGSGAVKSVNVASPADGISYVVKGQCSSTSKTDTIAYTVRFGAKAVGGTGAGTISCDGTYLLSEPIPAPDSGAVVSITLGDPTSATRIAYAVVEPAQ